MCQAYVQYHAGLNISMITVKHAFIAFICIACNIVVLSFVAFPKINTANVIPINMCIAIMMPIWFNIGFLVKEHTSTFPIIVKMVSTSGSVVSPLTEDVHMYPVIE